MPEWIVTAIGLAAGVFTTASWLPQLIKTWKSRSAGDFSWGYLLLFASGVGSCELYGILKRDVVIILANAVTLLLVIGVAAIKAQEKPSRPPAGE